MPHITEIEKTTKKYKIKILFEEKEKVKHKVSTNIQREFLENTKK